MTYSRSMGWTKLSLAAWVGGGLAATGCAWLVLAACGSSSSPGAAPDPDAQADAQAEQADGGDLRDATPTPIKYASPNPLVEAHGETRA